MFSAPPKTPSQADQSAIDPAEFQTYFVQQGRFTAGTATRYQTSIITGSATYQHLAAGFTLGMRFHSAPVVCLADAKPWQLGHVVEADGRWRIFLFAGNDDPTAVSSRLWQLCAFLHDAPASPVRTYTRTGADIDSAIDIRAIFQQGHRDLALDAMPPLLLPAKGRYGLRDYEKMFCAATAPDQNIFEMRGINQTSGCMVVVRPDQYVAHVLPLDGYKELSAFFAAFFIAQRPATAA
jgi:phenol 2-monooxygenase